MLEIYKERGGVWIGNGLATFQATWPFSSITVYENRVLLRAAWRSAEVLFSDIVEVKRVLITPFLLEGIRIIHKNENTPKLLFFWSFRHSKKIQQLIMSHLPSVVPLGFAHQSRDCR
jgi:hypothetical protein